MQANASKVALTHYNEEFQWPTNITYNSAYHQYFTKHTIFSLDHLKITLENM